MIATDPATGFTAPRPVTTLITGEGTKRLVDITVDLDGPRGDATDQITATDEHPFWVPDLKKWVPAGQLQPGAWLQTSAGTYVQITAVAHRTSTTAVYNLTVDDLHTYHVVAGDRAVLVHNENPTPDDVVERARWLTGTTGEYLYRGVTHNHWKYEEALEGIAQPRGGHSDPVTHSGGDTRSTFTSWTPDYETASEFSQDEGPGRNIVLRKRYREIDSHRMRVAGQRGLEELEIQIDGPVTGCDVSISGGPFKRPRS